MAQEEEQRAIHTCLHFLLRPSPPASALWLLGAETAHRRLVLLATKTLLDFVTIMIMTSSMGRLATAPYLFSSSRSTYLRRLFGGIYRSLWIISPSWVRSDFLIWFNMIWDKKIRIANMLPAVVLAVFSAFLPFSFKLLSNPDISAVDANCAAADFYVDKVKPPAQAGAKNSKLRRKIYVKAYAALAFKFFECLIIRLEQSTEHPCLPLRTVLDNERQRPANYCA